MAKHHRTGKLHLGSSGQLHGMVSRTQRPQHLMNSALISSTDTNVLSPPQFQVGPAGANEDVRSNQNKMDEQSEDSRVITQQNNIISPLSFDIKHTFHPSHQRG